MEYIEITAKTVDDAITNASVKLGVPSSSLDYVVIEKGSKGFLGINSKPAVIKARVKEEEPVKEVKATVKAEVKPEVKAEEVKTEIKNKEEKSENRPEKKQPKSEKKEAAKPEKETVKSQSKPEEIKSEDDTPIVIDDEEEIKEKSSRKAVAGPNMESAIKKFLTDVLGAMNLEAEVQVVIDEPNASVDVNLVGKDLGVLIGKRGQTLDSLQYLVSLVANRECEGYFRVKLDTENYRQRRKETLESLAKNIAYKVKRTRRPVSLEPMNPYERRIIHSTLQNDKYVLTRSEGEEPFRHVVIYLKKN